MIHLSTIIISSYLIGSGMSRQATPNPAGNRFGTIPTSNRQDVESVIEHDDNPHADSPMRPSGAPTALPHGAAFATPDPARFHFGTIPYFLGGGIGFVNPITSNVTASPHATARPTPFAI